MDKIKLTDKITVYYWGDVNSTTYRAKQTTVKTWRKWRAEGNKNCKGVAFLLMGMHGNIESYKLESYLKERQLEKIFSI